MMPSDFNCNWLIDAAAPIQGSAEYNARGIEVIIHEIDFENDDEFLSVGHTKSGYPSYNKRFFRFIDLSIKLYGCHKRNKRFFFFLGGVCNSEL